MPPWKTIRVSRFTTARLRFLYSPQSLSRRVYDCTRNAKKFNLMELAGFIPAAVVTAAAAVAWRARLTRRKPDTGSPAAAALALAGLITASCATALYLAFAIEAARVGGFGTDFRAVLAWARPGLWLSLTALVLSAMGKGTGKIPNVVFSALVLLAWVVPAWSM